jgi:hypothetical protein
MMRIAAAVLLSFMAATADAFAAGQQVCQPMGPLVSLPDLPEASGIAASTSRPLLLFAVNDSGEPTITVLDDAGKVVRTLQVVIAESPATTPVARRSTRSGLRRRGLRGDWEDVTVARCGNSTCLYIGDIGDNNRNRDALRIYRIELPPETASTTVRADVLDVTYPDRAYDAEAMFATPAGDLYIVTKESERAGIYKVPPFMPGTRAPLTRVAVLQFGKSEGHVTDADASPDGRWIALRTNTWLDFFHLDDLLGGRKAAVRVDLRPLDEPQGEGVTFGPDGSVYLVGEGGGKGRPGTFARLRCMLPRGD